MQSRGNGVRKASNSQFPEARRVLKAHDLYLGSMLFITKAAPSPAFRANLYMKYNIETGRLVIPEELDRPLKKLDKMLTGRTDNSKINLMEEDEEKL